MHKKEKPGVKVEPIIIEGREEPPEAEPDVRTNQAFVEGDNVETENNKRIPEVRSTVGTYLGIAAVAAVVGLVSGVIVGDQVRKYCDQIKAYYTGDLNGDSNQDFAFKNRNGGMLIYLGQEDGSYRRLEDIQAEMLRNVRDHVRGIRKRAEENLRDIVE